MRNDVMFTGVDNILSGFDRYNNAVFSVWKGKDLLFANNDTDISQARELLHENIAAYAAAGNNDALKIVFHPEPEAKYITNKTAICGTIYVRCSPIESISTQYYPAPPVDSGIMAKLNAIESRLNALDEEEEEDQVEESQFGSMMSGINELTANPVIMAFLGNLFKLPGQPQAIAGIPTGVEFNAALEYLSKADSDFESDIILLAKMAKDSPAQFRFVVNMLRKTA